MTLDEMAAELQRKGWSVTPPWTPETCKHENRIGSGSASSDGSSVMEWHCSRCGKSERIETPPRTDLPKYLLT